MPGFLDDADVKEKLRTRLGLRAFKANSNWDAIAADANNYATGMIVGKLSGRGFTHSQIISWDRLSDVQTKLALYDCLVNGGVTKDYDATLIRELNIASELDTVDVLIDGKLVQPGGNLTTGGGIRSGKLSAADDLFREPTPRRGQW